MREISSGDLKTEVSSADHSRASRRHLFFKIKRVQFCADDVWKWRNRRSAERLETPC